MAGIETARTIDLHAHARLDATAGAAGKHGPEFGTDENGKPWYRIGNYKLIGVKHTGSPFTDPDLRVKRMKECGIDFQVIGPSPLTYLHHIEPQDAISFCRKFNDGCAALLKRYPDHLGGLATLPMQDPIAARDELQRAVTELGLWGAQIGTDFGIPMDSPKLDSLYAEFVKLDVPLFVHPAPAGIDGPPGHPSLERFDLNIIVGFAEQESAAVATLIFGGVMERHPKLDVWISHGGGALPFLTGRLAQAGRKRPWASASMKKDGAFEEMLKRFWWDMHLNDARASALLTDLIGTERLVYGTNFAGWDDDGHHAPEDKYFADNARRLMRKTAKRAPSA